MVIANVFGTHSFFCRCYFEQILLVLECNIISIYCQRKSFKTDSFDWCQSLLSYRSSIRTLITEGSIVLDMASRRSVHFGWLERKCKCNAGTKNGPDIFAKHINMSYAQTTA